MSLQSLAKGGTTGKGLAALAGVNTSTSKDPSTLEGLTNIAGDIGLGQEAAQITDTTPKLSLLQRLGKGLGAFNPAEAILTGTEKGVGAGIGSYIGGIAKGIGSAISGKDIEGERRYFSDVAEKIGVKNGLAKFGIGFLGDVLLDPTTYFGGTIAKGVLATTKGVGSGSLKLLAKASPELEQGVKLIGTGLEDAIGKAFQYGYKSSVGAKEDLLSFMTKAQKAKLGIAASNLDRLGTGVLSQTQREELALKMIAGKRAEFVAREAGKTLPEAGQIAKETALTGTSPEVSSVIQKQLERSKKIGEGVGVENPYEVYFPFIKKDKVDKFINESKALRVGSEGYLKQFKNLLTNENMELDPAKAFFTRESQVVGDKMTRDFLTGFVGKYGKPLTEFKNVDEAIKNGFTLIKEKGNFGKELGYVSKFDGALIRDSLDPGFQTINMLAKATGFDAVTSLFKRSVTGLFAPFHIRNFMSGMIQNFEVLGKESLNPKNISMGQKIAYMLAKGDKIPAKTIEIGGKTMKLESLIKPFSDRFSGDTFYNTDFITALEKGKELKQVAGAFSKDALKETVKTVGLGTEATPFKVARAIGQFIEHQQKATAYITAIGQGKTIPEALRLAESAGFDYRALTSFESQILRRIVPFYSFTRKNIGLQLETLGENPQRVNQVLKFFSNMGEQPTAEEKKFLPSYIQESIGVKLPDTKDGLKQYISSFGTPIEGFTQLFGSNPILKGISQMNPLLKAPIEIGIGKDSFRQRDLKDVYTANEYKMAPQFIKDMLDIAEVEKPIYTKDSNGKMVKTGTRISYQADPVKLLIARSLFTSRGVSYLDQVFGNDMKGFVKTLKTTTGIKPQQIDLESQKYFKELEQKRALEDLLIRVGAIKKFENVYVPKK